MSVMWSTAVSFTVLSGYYHSLYKLHEDMITAGALKLYPIRADKQQIFGHRKEPRSIIWALHSVLERPIHFRLHLKWI